MGADQYDTLIRRCYPGSAETEGRAGQGRRAMPHHQDCQQTPHRHDIQCEVGLLLGRRARTRRRSTRAPGHEYQRGFWLRGPSEASRVHRGARWSLSASADGWGARTAGRIAVSGDGDEKEPGNPSQRGQKPTRMSDACEPCQAHAARALSKIRPAEFSFNRPPSPCLRSSGRLIGSQR